MTLSPGDAEARRRYSPPYASIVVDANTGRVLQATNADSLRFPASITKVMTLYMLFEQLERGRIKLSTRIPMTRHASRMPPSKLGLRPGQTISVDHAIRALVTKSANDVAAAVGDFIGGSEERFARMMTARARQLGMKRTTFRNASGLPDKAQVTTARDLTRLGRAIREHFPKYYGYFRLSSFKYGRRRYRNHNKLLGRVRGVDGIKTGYTRASGFNLLTSARLGKRRIIAVVLGGRSGRVRNRIMTGLVSKHIRRASTRRTLPMIAKSGSPATRVRIAAAKTPIPPKRPESLVKKPAVAAAATPAVQGAAEKAGKPMRLAAYAGRARPAVISGSLGVRDLVPTASIPNVRDGSTRRAAAARARTATPSQLGWVKGPSGKITRRARPLPRKEFVARPTPPARIAKADPAPLPPMPRAGAIAAQPAPKKEGNGVVRLSDHRPKAAERGVMIQVGATDDLDAARELLERARSRSRSILRRAKPFTEKIRKDGTTLYRARFAGLTERTASVACRRLKRSGMGCYATRN